MSRDTFDYTPAPWRFENHEWYGKSVLCNPDTSARVLVPGGINDGDSPIVWMGEELSDANARLITASPELYEVLTLILPMAKGYAAAHPVGGNAEKIKAAVALIERLEQLTDEVTI